MMHNTSPTVTNTPLSRLASSTVPRQSNPENRSETCILPPCNCLKAVLYIPQVKTRLAAQKQRTKEQRMKSGEMARIGLELAGSCIVSATTNCNATNAPNPTPINATNTPSTIRD
jgi:hypothetical protein